MWVAAGVVGPTSIMLQVLAWTHRETEHSRFMRHAWPNHHVMLRGRNDNNASKRPQGGYLF